MNGDYLVWFEDGHLNQERHYVHGKQEGIQKEYFPVAEGQIQPQLAKYLTYKDGLLNDEQKSYFSNGVKQAAIHYKNGILHGRKRLWNEEATLLEEANYIEGKLDGRYYALREDGGEIVFHYKDNQLEGLHQIYYPLDEFFGRIKALEATYRRGLLEGEFIQYNQAGTKISSTFYQNGLKEGLATLYSDEGRVQIAASFNKDKQSGMSFEYFPNGKVKKEVHFLDDLKEGEEKTFHENGQLAAHRFYKGGQLEGSAKEWSPHGVLIFEADYLEGKKHGKLNKYDAQGNPKILQTFAHDKLIEKKKLSD